MSFEKLTASVLALIAASAIAAAASTLPVNGSFNNAPTPVVDSGSAAVSATNIMEVRVGYDGIVFNGLKSYPVLEAQFSGVWGTCVIVNNVFGPPGTRWTNITYSECNRRRAHCDALSPKGCTADWWAN